MAEQNRESEAAAFGPCSLHPEERPQTVIGFTKSIYCEESDLWADAFWKIVTLLSMPISLQVNMYTIIGPLSKQHVPYTEMGRLIKEVL